MDPGVTRLESCPTRTALHDSVDSCVTNHRIVREHTDGIAPPLLAHSSGQGARPSVAGPAPHPEVRGSSVDCTHQSSRHQRETHGQPGLLGIASIRALSTVFTDSGVVKTLETSGSRTTTSRSRSPRPANRFGWAFR